MTRLPLRYWTPRRLWRLRRLWLPRWCRMPWHRDTDLIDDKELDRRLDLLNTALRDSYRRGRGADRLDVFLARMHLAQQRADRDAATLATPLSDNPTDAEVDQWFAALFREIVRRRRFDPDDESSRVDITDGIWRMRRWMLGMPCTPPPQPASPNDTEETQ